MAVSAKILKEREKYVKDSINLAEQYRKDVLSGKIKTSVYIKQAVRRDYELRKKYFYDRKSVEEAFRFFYYTKVQVGNKPLQFKPMGWQAWVIDSLFGIYRDKVKKKRLFRYALIWIARKSAKTTFSALLILYLFLKGERTAEAYMVATKKEQAGQALRYLKQIVKDSPALRKRVDIMQYQLRHEHNGNCIAKVLPNEPDTLDSLNVSAAIIDEAHALATKDLFNVLSTGTLSRDNPLILTISTAGFNKDYPFFGDIQIGKKVLRGEVEDDSTFYALYSLDEDDDINDPDNWIKANPSLGVTMTLDDMIVNYKKAKLTTTDFTSFVVKNLNVYQDGEETWIEDTAYKKCFKDVKLDDLKGSKCYLGLDLSSTRDLSSLVALIEDKKTGRLKVYPEFYFPTTENERNQIRASGIDLSGWIEKGWITPHKQRIIDHDLIFERIKWFYDNFDVIALSYDRWDASSLIQKVETNLLLDTFPTPQTTAFFTYPMRLLERLIYSENIDLSRSPVLRWNFRNVVIYTDTSGNVKPAKNKSLDSIDGVIALLEALGAYAQVNFDAVASIMEQINLD